jgi:transposase InsO family protein
VKYAWVKNHCDSYDVNTMCRVLEISRSGYYRWLHAAPSKTQCRVEQIGAEAKRVFEENHGSVGYRKVQEQLAAEGVSCCLETVRKTLTRQGLHATVAPRFVSTTTDSDHDLPVAANLLDRDFTAARPNEKWVSDITYVRTDEGWLYLAVVIDLFSRKVVGWAMAEHMRVELVLEAFNMAITHRRPTGELLFHSDRGSQYAATAFRERLAFLRVAQSMSRRGNCWDNAPAESFFGRLKAEWVGRYHYRSRDEAKRSLCFYIEMFYNSKRRHATIGYLSPNQFEAQRLAHAA